MERKSAARRLLPLTTAVVSALFPGPLTATPVAPPAEPLPVQATGSGLEPIPFPNLTAMDANVREQLERARAELEETIQRPGVIPEQKALAYGRMGQMLQTYDLLDASESCYRNALRLTPRDYRWSHYLALGYRAKGDLEQAGAQYRNVLTLRPNDLAAVLGLARIELEQGRTEAAAKHFQRALKLDPASAAAMAGLGEIAAAGRDYGKAVEQYEEALQRQPQASSLHYRLAMAYRQLGQVDKARLHLGKQGDGAVSYPDPLLEELVRMKTGRWQQREQANLLLESGQHDEAVRLFREMVSQDPTDALALVDLGTALAQMGRVEEAVQQFEAALPHTASKSRIHLNLSMGLIQMGREEKALEHCRKSVETDPNFTEAHFQLANLLMRRGLVDEAIPHYGRVIELDPGNAFAHFMGAMALVRTQRWQEARSRLEAGLTALPEDTDLTHAMARLLAACPDAAIRNGQQALRLLQKVFERVKTPDFEQVETLAMVYAELGLFDRAVQVQRMMISEVTRAQRSMLANLLQENLTRYQRKEACRQPWRENDPVFQPTPLPFSLLTLQ
ncbi:MAG: tetratricopeptide repeat protein [Candidatus Aminicenantes bacterium]|nr:tetratricopeptide repeat protein [Candidatus Aminicenantes bacterium]